MSAEQVTRPEPSPVTTEYVRKHYAQSPVFYQDRRTVAHWQTPADIEYAGVQFDRWLAAHDAEVRAGVVAEEPEWEYGVRDTAADDLIAGPQPSTDGLVPLFEGEVLERRRKAGSWVPVKQEDQTTNHEIRRQS